MIPDGSLKILVVGSGGREHALCWKLAHSSLTDTVFCAPGNGGTAKETKTVNIVIPASNFAELAQFSLDNKVDLVVVGPDNPLAEGIVDFMQKKGLRVFGPTKEAARLEWSKAYAKQFMGTLGLPTARYVICESHAQAQEAVKNNTWAQVVKVDGLALGKGVFVCDTATDITQALDSIFREQKFGKAGNRVVLEEKLIGEELSLLLLCDGKRFIELPACQDHKRRFDDDKGPNTGGMGAYSPVELYDRYKDDIESSILEPLSEALTNGTLAYQGVLYLGLLIGTPFRGAANSPAKPYLLEFNARFGDPEAQALIPRMKSDLLPVLWACTEEALDSVNIEWSGDASCCVVATAKSYPDSSSKGEPITIERLPSQAFLFEAGTNNLNGTTVTNGGRILSVTGLAPSMELARQVAYAALQNISFTDMDYRRDIARRAITECLSS